MICPLRCPPKMGGTIETKSLALRNPSSARLAVVVSIVLGGMLACLPITYASSSVAPATLKEFARDGSAGYGVYGPNGTVTGVAAIVIVPSVTCPPTSVSSEFFVAEDWHDTPDQELAALTISCTNGSATFGTLWMDSLARMNGSASFTPIPGDHLYLSVMKTGAKLAFVLEDLTQNLTSSVGVPLKNGLALPALNSSFCGGATVFGSGGALAQVPFHFAHFHLCAVKVNGKLQGIGHVPPGTVRVRLVDENGAGTAVIATPSILHHGHSHFVIWLKSSGP